MKVIAVLLFVCLAISYGNSVSIRTWGNVHARYMGFEKVEMEPLSNGSVSHTFTYPEVSIDWKKEKWGSVHSSSGEKF